MYKKITSVLVAGLVFITMAGCEKTSSDTDKETSAGKHPNVATTTIDYDSLYNKNGDEILVEVNGAKLSMKDLKSNMFKKYLVNDVNAFIDKQMLIKQYPASEEELKNERNAYKMVQNNNASSNAGFDVPTEEEIRYNIAYRKALSDGITVTDADLKKIYDNNFKNSGRTFEEMKDEIKKVAPNFVGNDVTKITQELRKKADIKITDETLKKEYDKLYIATSTSKTTDSKK